MTLRKEMIATLVFALLGGCADTVDIGALPEHYRELFREAAAIEGVGTTVDGWVRDEWDWSVELGSLPTGKQGTSTYSLLPRLFCRIVIDTDNLSDCPNGGPDQHFKQVSRHELRHCLSDAAEDSRPDHIMYPGAPCVTVD